MTEDPTPAGPPEPPSEGAALRHADEEDVSVTADEETDDDDDEAPTDLSASANHL